MRTNNPDLDELIEVILTDANGDGEQLWACLNAFTAKIPICCKATVIGKPVSILKFDFDGNERCGLQRRFAVKTGRLTWLQNGL